MKKSKSNKRTKKRGGTAWLSSLFGWGSSPPATPPATDATQPLNKTLQPAAGQAVNKTLQAVNKSATQPVAGQLAAGQPVAGQLAAGQPNRVADGSYFGFGGSRRRKPKRKTKKL